MQFKLSVQEEENYMLWLKKHDELCPYSDAREAKRPVPLVGAIGGARSFIFTPTGLGTFVQVKCACGATYTLTDYTNW